MRSLRRTENWKEKRERWLVVLVHWIVVSTPLSPVSESETARAFSAPLLVRLLEYWHLLSLDAPTVAIVWSWAFASASGIRLHFISVLLLGLATWLLYVVDRLLDGSSFARVSTLRDRHLFHARYRFAFLSVAVPGVCVLAWLVITRMERVPRHEDLILAGCALVYLLTVHWPRRGALAKQPRLFSKEAAVAIIFSAACIIPAWSRQAGMHPWLVVAGLPFCLLCWLNCISIETWESKATTHFSVISIRRRQTGLRPLYLCLAFASLLLAIWAWIHHETPFAALLVCEAVSSMLLYALDRRCRSIAPLPLRAAADAVLLTPAIFLIAQYLGHRF